MSTWLMRCVAVGFSLSALALVGCRPVATGQGPSGQFRVGEPKTDEAYGRPAEQLAGSSDVVTIENNRFRPNPNSVIAGTTVTWGNADAYQHNISSGARNAPDGRFSGDLPDAQASVAFTFTEPGTYAYHCNIHPDMNGQVVVK